MRKRRNKNSKMLTKVKQRAKFALQNRETKKGFIALFPKLSAVVFILMLFGFLSKDILSILGNIPLLYNYFFGVAIMAVLIMTWHRTKIAGASFIFLGILYWITTWDRILAVSTISTAFWLILTGLLFIVAEDGSLKNQKLARKRIRVTK